MLLSFLYSILSSAENAVPFDKIVDKAVNIADSIPKAIVSENTDKNQVNQEIKAEQPATQEKQRKQRKSSNKKVASPTDSKSKNTSVDIDQNTMNWIVVGSLLGVALFGLALIIIAKCMK